MNKSPFKVYENFLSPYLCEEIVDEVPFPAPDVDPENHTVKHQEVYDDHYEALIFDAIKPVYTELQQYYNFKYKGTERIIFEQITKGGTIPPHCESAEYLNRKWVKTKVRDFCGVIFLSDYNDKPPFDDEFECYGGKLEFINHQFGFNPTRGTMIVFPSDPRFVNTTSEIFVGCAHQIRFHIAAQTPYLYDPRKFPGSYTNWF